MWKIELLNMLDMCGPRPVSELQLERVQLRALPFRDDFHRTVIEIARDPARDAEFPRLLQHIPAKSDTLDSPEDPIPGARHVPLNPIARPRPVGAGGATTRTPAPGGRVPARDTA